MYVLGFNGYVFNAGAWLFRDGQVVAAAQEERFDRQKHSGAFPERAIRYCLDEAGITLDDVAHVGFHWQPFHQFHRRLGLILRYLPDSLRYYDTHAGRWSNMVLVQRDLVRRFPSKGRPGYRFHRVQHPHCHAASAFFLSPFERAALLTVDGSGEMASATMGLGEGGRLSLPQQVMYPHSLGYLYVALTHYLGFLPDSDEYKVMALASYGEPEFDERFRRLVSLNDDGTYAIDLRYFDYPRGLRDPWVSPRFVAEFGPVRHKGDDLLPRHKNLARALQKTLEETVLHMARHLQRTTRAKHLCYAGGTALNSVANTRLLHDAGFDDVFIQPAANDAGTGAGSALSIWHEHLGKPRSGQLTHALWGPAYSRERCREALVAAGLPFEEVGEPELFRRVAALLARGLVLGWFQGRMEVGPRALGNRSILADPRDPAMKDTLNARVKHREPFRPFAPAVLEEHAAEWFEWTRPSPFMLHVARIRPAKVAAIPAVAHVDGTARLQTVDRASNPRFRGLIEAFHALTGVPLVVNTSFNVMGEPIVCTPEDAVRCYASTALDGLVLHDLVSLRAPASLRDQGQAQH